jgi:hypothetical protein
MLLTKSRDLSEPHDFTVSRTKLFHFTSCFHGYGMGFLALTEEHKSQFFLKQRSQGNTWTRKTMG